MSLNDACGRKTCVSSKLFARSNGENPGAVPTSRHKAQRDREVHRIYPAEPEPEEPANRARDRFLRESLAVNMRQDQPAEHEEEIDGEIPARDWATYRPVVEDHD